MTRVLRGGAGVLGELLVTAGVLLLLFVAWQLWWTDVVAGREQAGATARLQQEWQAPAAPGPSAAPATDAEPPPVAEVGVGAAFAVVHVPRFGAGWEPRPVIEGTDKEVIDRGVGHYVGTAMPGGVGNFAVAGHRNTYGKPFHDIAELQEGDPVVVETQEGWFVYRATTSEVVLPTDVDVVAAVPRQPDAVPAERLMTMTACHPIFSARERYVQHALLDRFQPRSAGPPAELTAEPSPAASGSDDDVDARPAGAVGPAGAAAGGG